MLLTSDNPQNWTRLTKSCSQDVKLLEPYSVGIKFKYDCYYMMQNLMENFSEASKQTWKYLGRIIALPIRKSDEHTPAGDDGTIMKNGLL